jgi:hypothetical protein
VKQRYNHQYHPPIPILTVRLYSLVNDTFSPLLKALVDTGSDASLVPLPLLNELGAEETAPGWLVSITGERKPVSLFYVDVYIGDQALSGIRVIGDPDTDEVILGRDVRTNCLSSSMGLRLPSLSPMRGVSPDYVAIRRQYA